MSLLQSYSQSVAYDDEEGDDNHIDNSKLTL